MEATHPKATSLTWCPARTPKWRQSTRTTYLNSPAAGAAHSRRTLRRCSLPYLLSEMLEYAAALLACLPWDMAAARQELASASSWTGMSSKAAGYKDLETHNVGAEIAIGMLVVAGEGLTLS